MSIVYSCVFVFVCVYVFVCVRICIVCYIFCAIYDACAAGLGSDTPHQSVVDNGCSLGDNASTALARHTVQY